MDPIHVIIANYNGSKYVENCLRALEQGDILNVIFVDDCSTDDSLGIVRKDFPSVEVIENRKRRGAAESKNIGARRALRKGAEFIAFLDVDTKPEKGWSTELLDAIHESGSIGGVGSQLMTYDGREVHPTMMTVEGMGYAETFAQHAKASPDSLFFSRRLIGAAMLFTADSLLHVGLHDPGYFTYFEDSDLCRRMLYHGYSLAIVPRSRVRHESSSYTHPLRFKRLFYRNSMRYLLKDPCLPLANKAAMRLRYLYRRPASSSIIGIASKPVTIERDVILRESLRVFLTIPEIEIKTHLEMRGGCYIDQSLRARLKEFRL